MVVSRGLLVVLAVCTAVALTSCGGDDGSSAEPAGTSAPAPTGAKPPATPDEVPGADPGQMFTADPNLVGTHPIPFTSWTRVGANRIAVHFESGVPECYGVNAAVTEDPETVTVALHQGTRADATDKMCVMMAVFGTLEIQLDAPVGSRRVLSAV
ncbi:hypothetical protein [Nocardia sp. NPDC024068]|uniref:hypothetical protein n=1 Tax=Nocardia sp. NPDC024068 TaxID=3157197 RepID=UPI0033DD8CC7